MDKTRDSSQLLISLFRLRKVHKTYFAICHGELNTDSGEWNDNLIRYDGDKKIIEKAKTIFKVIDKNTNSIIVKTHSTDISQIRVLIRNLEDENELTDETQVIYLKHAQAEYLSETLKALTIQEGSEESSFIQIQPDKSL